MILGSDLYIYKDEVARLLGERVSCPHNFQLAIIVLKRGELQMVADIEAWAQASFKRFEAEMNAMVKTAAYSFARELERR